MVITAGDPGNPGIPGKFGMPELNGDTGNPGDQGEAGAVGPPGVIGTYITINVSPVSSTVESQLFKPQIFKIPNDSMPK